MKLITKAYITIGLILLQAITTVTVVNYSSRKELGIMIEYYPHWIIIFVNITALTFILIIINIMHMLTNEKESIQKLNNSQEVIHALQAQKHDFKNHLNVIAGMIQLERFHDAKQYIFQLGEKVDQGFAISKLYNIELAATLYRKCAIAESEGILVDLTINNDLKEITIDVIELCKIVFNLLDNAIYELERCPHDNKKLTIEIKKKENKYFIIITNSYPVLSPALYGKIFEKGYSTKKGENHGYGLHIIRQIVKKYHGDVEVKSNEAIGTQFIIRL